MRALAILLLVSATAAAAPRSAREAAKQAQERLLADETEEALALVEEGLGIWPRSKELLLLRGHVLLKAADYGAALAAYEGYLAAGATGGNRREVLRIVTSLKSVTSTFLKVTVKNGPANVYLDTRGGKPFCVADPTCERGVVPGDHLLVIDGAGRKRVVERLFVPANTTTTVDKTLVEKPSPLVVRVTPADALVEVDGAAAPKEIAAGEHTLTVGREGYVRERRPVTAAGGAPIELTVALRPGVLVTVTPPDAQLAVDGEAVALVDGMVPLPGPGGHTVTARALGYREATASVPAERPPGYRVTLALVSAGALLTVRGAPAGAALLVDGAPRGTLPLAEPIEVGPGDHTVEVRADGYLPFRKSAAFAERQLGTVRLDDMRTPAKTKAWIAGGVAGAGIAVGSVLGIIALGKMSDYNERATQEGVTHMDPELLALESDGNRFALLSDISFGVGLVALAASIYWFSTEGNGLSDGDIQFAPVGAGAGISARF